MLPKSGGNQEGKWMPLDRRISINLRSSPLLPSGELRGEIIEPAPRSDRQPDREPKRAVANWRFDQTDYGIGDFL